MEAGATLTVVLQDAAAPLWGAPRHSQRDGEKGHNACLEMTGDVVCTTSTN